MMASNWTYIRLLLRTELFKINKKAHMIFIYGDSVEKILILTEDDMVYSFIHNKNKCYPYDLYFAMKIETMCGKNIKTFTAGSFFLCALTNTGKVYCWQHSILRSSLPMEITANNQVFIDISSCLQSDKCWAVSDNRQIFMWTEYILKNNDSTPIIYPGSQKYTSISCSGGGYVMAVTINGEVHKITYSDKFHVEQIVFPGNVSIVKTVCGCDHRLALSDTGQLYVWGSNSYGMLGIGTNIEIVSSPVQLKNDEMGRISDVAALSDGTISVAIGEGDRVFVWGDCMERIIATPLCCNSMSLSNVLLHFSRMLPSNKTLILEGETNIRSHLRKAFEDTTTSDFIIEVHGKSIHVHKAILKIRSEYFRTMFQNHWKENDQGVVHSDQFSYDVFKGYLNYLYTDQIDLPDIDQNIPELFELADAYNEPLLMNHCRTVLTNQLNPNNVATYYNGAVERDNEEIQKECIKFASDHWAKVVNTSSFMELSGSVMKSFIIKLVKNGAF